MKTKSDSRSESEGWRRHRRDGLLKALVLADPKGDNFARIADAVDIVNRAQSYYRLQLETNRRNCWKGGDRRAPVSADALRRRIFRAFPNQLVIAVIEQALKSDFTIDEAPGCSIITCDDWPRLDGAESIRTYLVYQLASALVSFAACLTVAENVEMFHDEEDDIQRGCLFDYWTDEKKFYSSMVGGRLCQRCQSALRAHQTSSAAIAATSKLLDWVRSVILDREQPLPFKVFIGHGGKSNDWQALRNILREWNLEVAEFNERPAAGIATGDRLKAMLAESCFAFLVMTGEDRDDQGHRVARLNVIHEIGLFQGRLGSEYAVILREHKAKLFSNIDGINRIDFERGKIDQLADEIKQLLIDRGVIPADPPDENDP